MSKLLIASFLRLVDMAYELVELTLPTVSALIDPVAGLVERPAAQPAPTGPALLVRLHKPCLLQRPNMLQNPGQRHVERRSQLGNRYRTGAKPVEDLATVRVCQRRERAVESRRILNHLVHNT